MCSHVTPWPYHLRFFTYLALQSSLKKNLLKGRCGSAACNHSTWEAEWGSLRVQGQPKLQTTLSQTDQKHKAGGPQTCHLI